jgi:hypothetical protein
MVITLRTTAVVLLVCLTGCSKTVPSTPVDAVERPTTPAPTLTKKTQATGNWPERQPTDEVLVGKPTVEQSKKPVFKLYVKVEKIQPEKIEFVDGDDWIDQYRTSLIEGDLKKPTRVTTLLQGSANCGSWDTMVEEGAGEDQPRTIYFLNCWNAGAGHIIQFFQDGQTITVEKSSVSEDVEDHEFQGPDDGEIHTLEVPKGVKVEFEILYP